MAKRDTLKAIGLVCLLFALATATEWYGDPPGQLECPTIGGVLVVGCRAVPASGGAK